jgi:hypothetical protein
MRTCDTALMGKIKQNKHLAASSRSHSSLRKKGLLFKPNLIANLEER